MAFPKPPPLPSHLSAARTKRKNFLLKCTKRGIYIRLAIVVIELLAVVYFESASLFMDALSMLMDIAGSILLIIFINYAAKPPDKNHPFGHGRLEPIIGLEMGLFMGLIGFGLFIQFVSRMTHIGEIHPISPYVWIIPLFSALLLEGCYYYLKQASKKADSSALLADARHYRVDAITSLLAAASLLVSLFYPPLSALADQAGAMIISLLMIYIGIQSSRDNIGQLMDKTPDLEYFGIVKIAAEKVHGVKGTEKIRIQHYGPDSHVDIDVEVDPKMSVDDAHRISQKVRVEIQKAWPKVRDVTVHIEPFYPNDHV